MSLLLTFPAPKAPFLLACPPRLRCETSGDSQCSPLVALTLVHVFPEFPCTGTAQSVFPAEALLVWCRMEGALGMFCKHPSCWYI